MKAERWQQLDKLFHSAMARAPNERPAFLEEACAGDEELRKEAEALLAAGEQAGSFIENPALEVEARSLADEKSDTGAASMVGKTIGHYRLIAPLGSGGMGEVFLAEDTVLSRQVALKLLPEYFARDQDRLRRFQQEARAASALNHPNIITIFEIGESEGGHFIATEFIDGTTLRQHCLGEGRQTSGASLQLRKVLDIAIQTADALAAAHEAHIVHRDIKPDNIMLRRRDGYVKVLDFGLAKLTEGETTVVDSEASTMMQVKTSPGLVMGTVSYMSPEQARGEKVDARTDLWSLGVVVYEMVAGCVPFKRSTPSEVIGLILEREPPPLARYTRELPTELDRIVSKALTKDKEERYQTAKDLLVDLRRLRQRLEVEAEIERTGEPPEKSSEEKAVATGREQKVAVTARTSAVETRDAVDADSASSPAYLVKGIKLHQRGALIALATLIAVTAVVGYFAYSRYWAEGGRANIDSSVGIRSIAVLPFANTSKDPETEYLSDGISESLINSLSQLPGMKVIARSSSFKYKGKEVDPQEVARALGVAGVLTGRVTQRGDNLLISVELMDARDKTQVWGEQYNRKTTDLLQVQEDISREITEKLRLRLTAGAQQHLARRETANPAAYDLMLKGRFFSRKGGTEDQKKAIEYFKQALAVDFNYALAYAELSASYSYLVSGSILDPKEFTPKAEGAARRALELDESLADAHFALANIKRNSWDWATAEREYKRAIELNPNLADAYRWYSRYLGVRNRHEQAITEMKRARELDPLSLLVSADVGFSLFIAREYDQAIDSLKKTLELDQKFSLAHNYLAYTYAAKGMYAEAIAEHQEVIKLDGDSSSTQVYLGAAYAKAGERGKAQEILKRLQTSGEYVSPGELAVLYAALGEREQAFASLEKAYAAHDLQMQYLGIDPALDNLRSDSRFQGLMRRVGLTP